MKNSKFLKTIAKVLSILILVQSCRIYQNTPTSLENAVYSGEPVKVLSNNSQKFKFNRLEKKQGRIYGYAKHSSKTTGLLSTQIIESESSKRWAKILLEKEQINKIYPLDGTAMVIFNAIVFGLGGLFSFVVVLALAWQNS